MKPLPAAAALTFALALLLPTAPARAGDNLNTSDVSVLLVSGSAVMVVSGPVFLSAAGVNRASELSRTADAPGDGRRRISAGPLPDMQVKAIAPTADGGRSVTLVDPRDPANSARLQWPQREDNPAANFVPGQTVAFTPSPRGSGWMLRAEDGAVLTFVPTIEAADDSHSATL